MKHSLSQPTPRLPLSPRQVLFLLLSACLGALAGYEVGAQVGVALAPRPAPFLAPGYSLWPSAMIGAVLGVVVFVPLMWSLRGANRPSQAQPSFSSAPAAAANTAQEGAGEAAALAKAPPGTYVVAFLRGAFVGGLLAPVLTVLAVAVVIGPHDRWFWAFVAAYGLRV